MSFNEAFAKARKKFEGSGKTEDFTFKYKGDDFTVLKKGESKKTVMNRYGGEETAPKSSPRPKAKPSSKIRGPKGAPSKTTRVAPSKKSTETAPKSSPRPKARNEATTPRTSPRPSPRPKAKTASVTKEYPARPAAPARGSTKRLGARKTTDRVEGITRATGGANDSVLVGSSGPGRGRSASARKSTSSPTVESTRGSRTRRSTGNSRTMTLAERMKKFKGLSDK